MAVSPPAAVATSVKVEVSSDDEEEEHSAAAVFVANDSDYSSCTVDDVSSIASDCQQHKCAAAFADDDSAMKATDPASRPQPAVFDKDDDAACDDLLMDILSGDGQPDGDDDGFLSLLADDIVNLPCSASLESVNGFVKQEIEF